MRNTGFLSALLATQLFVTVAATAEEEARPPAGKDTTAAEEQKQAPEPASSTTQHQVQIDGQTIRYKATVGWLIMKDEKDKPIARFGYTAYAREGVKSLAERPVTFAFNGGPGSSSIWLHTGILGPRRIVVNDGDYTPPPPARYVDNGYSIIDVTDLVMIDPVGTGFSKPLGKAKGSDFWGVDQDIRSVGAFGKRYVSENGRWASPKYILGESYGGMRAAGLVHHLQSLHGMNFNGIVLVSPFLSAGSGDDGMAADLPHVLYLPTLAATAWYHDAVTDKPASLEAFVEEVARFAYDEYAPALMKGYVLTAAERQEVAGKLARYTGTSAAYWEKADLRVSHTQFLQELQRDRRLITGRIDSCFVGPAVNPLGEKMDYDPFFPAIGPAFTAGFLDYLHNELAFGRDENYTVSNFELVWDWKHQPLGEQLWISLSPNTVPDLALAMTMNPGLHVLVQQGWYDLATPHLAMMHDIEHLDITAEARERVRIQHYDAGHMMYVHEPSMRKFRDDLAGFIRDTDRL